MKPGDMKLLLVVLAIVLLAGVLHWVNAPADQTGFTLLTTESGGLKAYGRYQGEMVKGWVPIAVDKEGRVICSSSGG